MSIQRSIRLPVVRSFSNGETRTNDAIVLPATGGVVPNNI